MPGARLGWFGPASVSVGRRRPAAVRRTRRPGERDGLKIVDVSEESSARVVLLGKPGCHLCDDARRVVERVASELGESYVERDVTADPVAMREHGESIPVVFVDGVVIDFWRVSETRLRAALGHRPGADRAPTRR